MVPRLLSEYHGLFNESLALEYLTGTVFSDEGLVKTTVFLDRSTTTLDPLTMSFSLKSTEYGSIRDLYSLATLYAIALDAKRLGLPTDVMQSVLSRAFSISRDLAKKTDLEENEIVKHALVSAIQKELNALVAVK